MNPHAWLTSRARLSKKWRKRQKSLKIYHTTVVIATGSWVLVAACSRRRVAWTLPSGWTWHIRTITTCTWAPTRCTKAFFSKACLRVQGHKSKKTSKLTWRELSSSLSTSDDLIYRRAWQGSWWRLATMKSLSVMYKEWTLLQLLWYTIQVKSQHFGFYVRWWKNISLRKYYSLAWKAWCNINQKLKS